MRRTSIRLFNAWTEKNHELVVLQKELDAARLADSPDVPGLETQRRVLKGESEAMLADALSVFNEELRARGLR